VDSDPSDVALSKIAASAAALLSTGLSANPERAVWALCVTVGLDPPGSPFAGMEPRQLHREIVEAWRSYFSALAESGPTTVVIEDLHWADPAMLQLLGDLVDTAQGALLFLCPSRPDLATRRREWGGGRHNGSSILLQPLPVPDAARLLDLLAADALSPEQRGLVLERAGGNPLFLEELIRYFVLDRPPARTSRHVAEAAEIPDTVQGLLAARMDLLDPADKRVLQSAAVVGRVFWNGPVLRLLNGEGERLDESLRRLQERGLVEVRLASSVRDEDEYVFNHVLTRDVAYESLPRRERGPAHARVAAWLEERVSERASEFSELLAHHYGEAHRMISRSDHVDPEAAEELRRNAFRFSLLAAEQARAKLVLDVAARFAESALSMASGPLELSVALEELGAIRYLNSQGDEGWENLTQALDLRLSVEPDDHRDIARLAGRALEIPARAPGTMRTRPPRAAIEPYLEIGLEHAGENDSEELARLLIAHSFLPVTAKETYIPEHEWRQARQAGERAAEMALRLHRPDLASAALDGLAMPFMERDQWGQADRIVRRRLALTESLSDAWELADIFASASQAALFIGRFREAEGFADQGILAAGSAAPPLALYCLNWRAWARQCRGAWDEAMQDVEAVRARLGDLRERPPALAADTFAVAAFISEARGDPTGADEALRTLSWLEEVEDRPGPGWASFRAQVLARRGEFAEAHAALDAAHGDEGHDYGRGVLLQARCAVVELEGNWDRAPALAVTALAHATEAGLLALPLFSGRLNAIVALANGDDAAGIEALGAAARGLHDLGAEWEAARADLALAEALRARSEASAVRALLDRSIRTFQRLGSVAELQRAQELVDAI
jgi:hypothetical protein